MSLLLALLGAPPAATPFAPTGFEVPPKRAAGALARAFDGYIPFVAPAATPFTPGQFDTPAASRRPIRATEWSFIGAPTPAVFSAFDAPRRQVAARCFDAYTPFVPLVALATFTPLPFDAPRFKRTPLGFDPYAAFVPTVAALPVFMPAPFDQPAARRGRLDFAAYSPFVPVVQVPFVALALDRPQMPRAGRSSAAVADAYVPFTPFIPPVVVLLPFLDWPRQRTPVQIQRASFDFGDTGYYTDADQAPPTRGPLFQWLAGQESYWRGN